MRSGNEKLPYRRARQLLATLFLAYALLVSTHLGEFWPFSVFPMFSQGGHHWERSLVREVTIAPDSLDWQATTLGRLPGRPYALDAHDISQNDVAGFLFNAASGRGQQERALRRLFADETSGQLLFMRAELVLSEDNSAAVSVQPYLLLTPDSVYFNPYLEKVRAADR